MSCCQPKAFGKSQSIYSLSNKQRTNLAKKLPQLTQKRILLVAKHILFNFLDNHADYIFTNGKIYTMNQKDEEVEAVAIKGNQIQYAGKMIDALAYKGQKTKIIDLKGKTMLPGFIDPHIHMCFTMFRHWVDMSPFVNADMSQVQQKLKNKVQQVKSQPNQWVTGQLFDPSVTHGQFDYSIQNLDKICPDNPMFILQANGHIAHVNSLALKAAGISHQSKDPPFGRYMRNNEGKLTGQLQQFAVIAMNQFIMVSGDSYRDNFKHFLQQGSSKGCTTLHDCGIGLIDPQADLAILLEVMQDNPPVRYSGFLVSTSWDLWMQQKMVPQNKDPFLRINGIKCWADGSTQGGSAFLRQQYFKKQWQKGKANYSMQTLVKSIKLAHDNGWQVGVHANGDAAIDLVLDAFEIVQKQNPKPQLRHRIQHCTVCHKEQLKRMKELNIHPSFLIGHVYYYGYAFKHKILGPERASMIDPMRSAAQLGLRPTMHSDYNCQPLDPIRCIYNSVTRKMKHDGQVLGQSQTLTPYQAVKAITIDSAWQCHMEDIVGSIQKGKKADFVILNEDPMMIPQSQILHVKVQQTWMDGVCRFKNNNLQTVQSFNSDNSSLNQSAELKLSSEK